MERAILDELQEWKEGPRRKPLILEGARQVGKTWALQAFGDRNYENTAYFNFDENPDYAEFFTESKDVSHILQNLRLISGERIEPRRTLLVFDEIQDSPAVINSLKYFCENAPEYHVACAGSLLGITLAKPSSFPVGKVNLKSLHPMTFTEYLRADNAGQLADYLDSIDTLHPIPEAFFRQLIDKLRMYFVTGGMPEPVSVWTQDQSLEDVEQTLADILGTYERDFAKHPKITELPKISLIWKSLPSQLAKENKKFLYRVVKEGARAREYESALQWLVSARMLYRVYRNSAPGLPLSAYDDLSAFKIYAADVGILRRLAKLPPAVFDAHAGGYVEFKGALTENFVHQALLPQFEDQPRYWSQNNPPYEVDFLVQSGTDVIPIEVKADKNIDSKSLQKFKELFGNRVRLRVRFSSNNLRLDNDVLNIPLFMADHARHLIDIALEQLS